MTNDQLKTQNVITIDDFEKIIILHKKEILHGNP